MTFERKKVLENTGIEFDFRQLVAINNVERYMLDEYYNEDTIYKDIDVVNECYDLNPYSLNNFFNILIYFLNKKAKEVEKFNDILLNPNSNYYYQELLQYGYLPFRYSKNPKIDIKLISEICRLVNPSYRNIIYFLTDKEKKTQEYREKLHNFIDLNYINHERFGKGQKVGWIKKYPETDEEIIKKFNHVRKWYNITGDITDTHALGNYAELKCMDYIKRCAREEENEIIWVSRYIGDGFGYDIMVHDLPTDKDKIVEVKGSLSLNQENNIYLTTHETKVLEHCVKNNIEHHAIKLFFDKDITRIYDVRNRAGIITTYTTNGRFEPRTKLEENQEEKTLSYRLRPYDIPKGD